MLLVWWPRDCTCSKCYYVPKLLLNSCRAVTQLGSGNSSLWPGLTRRDHQSKAQLRTLRAAREAGRRLPSAPSWAAEMTGGQAQWYSAAVSHGGRVANDQVKGFGKLLLWSKMGILATAQPTVKPWGPQASAPMWAPCLRLLSCGPDPGRAVLTSASQPGRSSVACCHGWGYCCTRPGSPSSRLPSDSVSPGPGGREQRP